MKFFFLIFNKNSVQKEKEVNLKKKPVFRFLRSQIYVQNEKKKKLLLLNINNFFQKKKFF
jgi:hypothetical protein